MSRFSFDMIKNPLTNIFLTQYPKRGCQDVIDAKKQQYSVRSYADRDVSMDDIMELIEAARLAPSPSNRQEWQFVVVRDAGTR